MNRIMIVRYEVWTYNDRPHLHRVYRTYREASLHAMLLKGQVRTIESEITNSGPPRETIRLGTDHSSIRKPDVWDKYGSR